MYQFPEGFYTEVTVTKTTSTTVVIKNGIVKKSENNTRADAVIRIFDGVEWMEKTISDVRDVEVEIQKMIERKQPDPYILEKEEIKIINPQTRRNLKFCNMNITHLPIQMKENLTKACYELGCSANLKKANCKTDIYENLAMVCSELVEYEKRQVERKEQETVSAFYKDRYSTTSIVSSIGADYMSDEQNVEVFYQLEKAERKGRRIGRNSTDIDMEKVTGEALKNRMIGHFFEEVAEQVMQLRREQE